MVLVLSGLTSVTTILLAYRFRLNGPAKTDGVLRLSESSDSTLKLSTSPSQALADSYFLLSALLLVANLLLAHFKPR